MKNKIHGRIAINGMGRIGRSLFRLLRQYDSLSSLIAVNDVMAKENLIYLLKYDSIRGVFPDNIVATENGFSINGHEILYFQQGDLKGLPWKKYSIDTVIESTGLFTHSSDATNHLTQGASRVLLTTYSKDIASAIWGVNQDTKRAQIISPGDCTINCVAPIIHVIQKSFGIDSLHINVIQGYTTRQELIDAPYKGLRRGRAAAHSIIPFEVNIKPVLENVFPALSGKLESMSTRVPVPCGALADLSFVLSRSTDAREVNEQLTNFSEQELKGILSITFDPIVSSDILNNTHSGVIDGSLTKVTNRNHLKLLAWFDNEWGYTHRLFDWLCSFEAN